MLGQVAGLHPFFHFFMVAPFNGQPGLSGETGVPVDVENTSIEDALNRMGMEKGITEKRIFDLREN